MSREEEKWIKRLEILGASAAAIVIVSAVGTFLLDSIAMQLMALAVGCGSIVNVVLMVLCYYKKKDRTEHYFYDFCTASHSNFYYADHGYVKMPG